MAEFNNKLPFVLKEMQNWVTTKISDAMADIKEWCNVTFSLNTHNHDTKYDSKGSASAVQTNLNAHDNNTTKHITASERTTWNSKANASHSHTTSQISGLDTALAGKAASNHTHTASSLGIGSFPKWTNVINISADQTYTAATDGYLMIGVAGGNGNRQIQTNINGTTYVWNGDNGAYQYGWGCMQVYLPIAKGVQYSFSYASRNQEVTFARFVSAQ